MENGKKQVLLKYLFGTQQTKTLGEEGVQKRQNSQDTLFEQHSIIKFTGMLIPNSFRHP